MRANRPHLTGETRYTAHGKAINFVVAGQIAEGRAAKTQHTVNNSADVAVKLLHHVKNASE